MNKSSKRQQRKSGFSRDERLREKRPPPFIPTVKFTHKFRFTNSGVATAVPVTRGNLLNLIQMATSVFTSVRVFAAVKLVSVEVWTPPPTTLGTAKVSLEWKGANAPSTIKSDNAMGVLPAHIHTSPPVDSSSKWWSISGSNESEVLFVLTTDVSSVLDVVVLCSMIDDDAPIAGDAITGGTLGQLYFNYLDGLVSGKFIPDGGVSILP